MHFPGDELVEEIEFPQVLEELMFFSFHTTCGIKEEKCRVPGK